MTAIESLPPAKTRYWSVFVCGSGGQFCMLVSSARGWCCSARLRVFFCPTAPDPCTMCLCTCAFVLSRTGAHGLAAAWSGAEGWRHAAWLAAAGAGAAAAGGADLPAAPTRHADRAVQQPSAPSAAAGGGGGAGRWQQRRAGCCGCCAAQDAGAVDQHNRGGRGACFLRQRMNGFVESCMFASLSTLSPCNLHGGACCWSLTRGTVSHPVTGPRSGTATSLAQNPCWMLHAVGHAVKTASGRALWGTSRAQLVLS